MRFRWTMIRGIGSSIISRVSLSVPILAFIILQDDRVVAWFQTTISQSHAQQNAWEMPSIDLLLKTKLYMIYFGAYIFGIASLIYNVFVPSPPRKFQDEADYAEKTLLVTTLRDVINIIGKIDRAESWLKRQTNPIDTELAMASLEDANLPDQDRRRIYLDVLKSHYCMENERNQVLIFIIGLMYCVSMALLAMPSFLTFIKLLYSFWSAL